MLAQPHEYDDFSVFNDFAQLLILTLTIDCNYTYSNYYYCTFTLIMKTFEASQVQKVSGSGSIMITDFVIVARKTLIFTCDYLDNEKR